MQQEQDIIALFKRSQLEVLSKNFNRSFRCNDVPAARLYFEKLGHSILLNQLYPEAFSGFGLCEYDSYIITGKSVVKNPKRDLRFQSVSLPNLAEIASLNKDRICIDKRFVGKYPLAVYAKVAEDVGEIVYRIGDAPRLFKEHAIGDNLNTANCIHERGGFGFRKAGFQWQLRAK